jgi:hypothetical protein
VKPLPEGRLCAQIVLGIKGEECGKHYFGFVGYGVGVFP